MITDGRELANGERGGDGFEFDADGKWRDEGDDDDEE